MQRKVTKLSIHIHDIIPDRSTILDFSPDGASPSGPVVPFVLVFTACRADTVHANVGHMWFFYNWFFSHSNKIILLYELMTMKMMMTALVVNQLFVGWEIYSF